MRGVHLFLALAVGCLVLAPAATAKGIEAQRGPALDYLAGHLAGAGPLAANIAEAAHANGVELATWPTASDPVADHVPSEFGEGASDVSLLRPLRALALLQHPAAAPEGALTQRVLGRFGPDGYGDPRTLNDDAYAILALRAVGFPAGHERVQAAREQLLRHQGDDGGWGWAVGSPSGADLTGLAVEALVASGGVPDGPGLGALAFLASTRAQAGFAETPGGAPNCESTVWGLRATQRLGQSSRDGDWRFLLGLQRADGGFAHLPSGPSDLLCTSEAATLLGQAHAGDVAAPAPGRAGIPAHGLATAVAAVALAAARLQVRRP